MKPGAVAAASADPVLRWAGSKRWLVRQGLAEIIGPVDGTYIEPFLGSASAFLAVSPGRARLADLNPKLMNVYSALRANAHEVCDYLDEFQVGQEAYYVVRAAFPSANSFQAAAQFIYLNTFCFNGLYRENSKGKFNVPYGRPKNDNLPDRTSLETLGKALERATLISGHFLQTLSATASGDTVYLDPPYVSGHRANGFVDYNSKLFRWSDQEELAREFRRLDRKGVRVFLSNADHPSVRKLYPKDQIVEFSRHSSMSGNSVARGLTQEILVTNVQVR